MTPTGVCVSALLLGDGRVEALCALTLLTFSMSSSSLALPLLPSLSTRMPRAQRSCRAGRTVGTGWPLWAVSLQLRGRLKRVHGDEEGSSWFAGTLWARRHLCTLPVRAQLQVFFPYTAVDEQNAQTQEQEGFALSLSESEEKKDPKSDDRVCPTESCGVAKGRSLRKGTSQS